MRRALPFALKIGGTNPVIQLETERRRSSPPFRTTAFPLLTRVEPTPGTGTDTSFNRFVIPATVRDIAP
jgi:hypothetical protein